MRLVRLGDHLLGMLSRLDARCHNASVLRVSSRYLLSCKLDRLHAMRRWDVCTGRIK